MIKGLTQAGIGNIDTIEQFIQLASKYGFGSIDSGGSNCIDFIEKHSVEGAKAFLKDHHIQIANIGLSVEWRQTDEVFRKGLTQLTKDAEAASALGCTTCCTYVLPSTDLNAAHFMALATKRLRLCADILGTHGIRLGLEFVGPHHLRTKWKHPFIWDMPSTLDWIDALHAPNVGLLFDAYHWYTNESTIEDIHALNASQIVHVHINDAPDLPIPDVLDNGRLYPGEGVIDLPGFLRALNHIGYKGSVSQEILTQEPPQGKPEELIKKSAAAFDKVYTEAGLSS